MKTVSLKWYVYIVGCADGTFYTGTTTDVAASVEEHNAGKGPTYTKWRLPVQLQYEELVGMSHKALSRCEQIRRMSKKTKQELIRKWLNEKLHERLDSVEGREKLAIAGIDFIRSRLVK